MAQARSAVRLETGPRLGLSRAEAAQFLGISVTKFNEAVETGRMPRPRRLDGRLLWDVPSLTRAYYELPEEGPGGVEKEEAAGWDDL